MPSIVWGLCFFLLAGCALTPYPAVVDSKEAVADCFFLGTVTKIGKNLDDCKKEAKISAREVHATHILWVETIPEQGETPAYLKGAVFKCD